MTDANALYVKLRVMMREIRDLCSARDHLAWDMETIMPPKGAEARASVIGALEAAAHARVTSPEYGDLLFSVRALSHALDDAAQAAVALAWKERERAVCQPNEFVRELSSLAAASHHVWADARARSDFAAFAPNLAKLVAMKREQAGLIADRGPRYDALLEEYDPGMSSKRLTEVLGSLRACLTTLVRRIGESPLQPRTDLVRIAAPRFVQEGLCHAVARGLGFDMDGGRIDASAHPFMNRMHPGDVRLTTRYIDDDALSSVYSIIHEAGHGLYEQGLPDALFGTRAGEAPSYGLHESQSRLWENMVGRGLPFWTWFSATLRGAGLLGSGSVSCKPYWRAINAVTPSFIRTEADEVTYNLHICLRFEIERDLIEGRLEINDVRDAWNDKMRDYLGLTVEDDAQGVLQDVHWSAGLFGYFPSYAIGNLYAAQFYAAARRDLPELDAQVSRGEFAPLLGWLREKVHRHGSTLRADEIVRRATGSGLDQRPFMDYLERKYSEIYAL